MKIKIIFILVFLFLIYHGKGQHDSASSSTGDTAMVSSPLSLPFGKITQPVNAAFLANNYFVGSHYLFDRWVRGSVVAADNQLIKNDSYYYNYDKVSNVILLTVDLKQVIEIDKREFKAFAFKDDSYEYFFEHVPMIDNKKFFQVLVENDKYSLYKWTFTKFRKLDNFSNLGAYVDIPFYYVLFPNGRLYKKVDLKKKSIVKNLFTEPEKVEYYFSLHQYNAIDEALLVDLINYLNK